MNRVKATPGPQRNRASRSSPLRRRLGLYFVGVAIGLVLVGFLLSLRGLMVEGATRVPGAADRSPID